SFSISGHKIHGPKGVGALYIKNGIRVSPLLIGGSQEMDIRSGTENVPGIYGLGEAVRLTMEEQDKNIEYLNELRNYAIDAFKNKIDGIYIISGDSDRFAPHIINISFPGVKSEIMLHSLEQDGIYVSSGSACSSRRKEYSHVLKALNIGGNLIDSSIRFSLSYINTKDEIDYAVEKTKEHFINLRDIIGR
ncbi:MAG: aminotransferase class V-fold PLP-dependent enzyme, partial [Clostridiales bacterium]|nr:aminotransferase class V-fold PLP-dependent enzyme [Clostridiales bacterium]